MKKKYLILFAIIFLGAFLRLYRLNGFPVQLNHDEVTQLYDAISIAQTGRDIYGNFLPFIFPSIGDFKPPFYTYVTSIFYLLFGSGEITIRLTSVMFGVLMIPAVYFFSLKLLRNIKISLFSAFITSTAPFEIFFSRKSFESGAGIFLMLLGFTFFLEYVNYKSKSKLPFLAFLFFGLALYTYFSHAVIIPILIFVFILINRKFFKGSFKKLLPPIVLLIFLFLPILIMILTNASTRYRSQTVFVTQDISLGRNIEYSKQTNPLLSFLTRNKAIFDFSFNRYLEQFDFRYIFGNGLEFTNQGSLGMGPLLLIQLPFLILGTMYLIKIKGSSKEKKFIVAWVLIGMLPSGLTFETHSPHRSIMVFTMLNIICASGLYFLLKLINSKLRAYSFRRLIYVLLCFTFLINYTYFIHMYFVNFPFEKSQDLHYPFKQIALYVWSQHDKYDQIIFDPLFGETAPVVGVASHYYFAYYGNFSPAIFQKEYRLGNKGREIIFDKFSLRKIDWREDRELKKVLLIASPWSIPIQSIERDKILKTFNFYDGKIAFYAISL